MRSRRSIAAATTAVLSAVGTIVALPYISWHKTAQHRVDFSRDIRPILNQSCVSCHGGVRQKNGVSFIYREEALGKGKSGRRTIVPGHPETSELMARIASTDPETRMPYHAPPLQPEQIVRIQRNLGWGGWHSLNVLIKDLESLEFIGRQIARQYAPRAETVVRNSCSTTRPAK